MKAFTTISSALVGPNVQNKYKFFDITQNLYRNPSQPHKIWIGAIAHCNAHYNYYESNSQNLILQH